MDDSDNSMKVMIIVFGDDVDVNAHIDFDSYVLGVLIAIDFR